MNIGKIKRTIEIVPTDEPLPAAVPIEAPAPTPEPERVPAERA